MVLVDRDEPGRGASFGNAGHIATEQVFPLASPETMRAAPGYLLDAEGPLKIRAAYALRILPWLARFAWASRRSAYERGVAAISSLQETARLVPNMRLWITNQYEHNGLRADGEAVVGRLLDMARDAAGTQPGRG